MQEMQILPLGQEDPLEKEMATHSSPLARRIPQTDEPGWAIVLEVTKSQTQLIMHTDNFICDITFLRIM